MFVAVALDSQVLTAALFAGSKLVPFTLRRLRPASIARSSDPMSDRPFLLPQKPMVNPPPSPVQTLPKDTLLASPAARVCWTEVGVVANQFGSIGLNSLAV